MGMPESDIDLLKAVSDSDLLSITINASQYAFPFWTGNAIGHYGMKDEWERLYKEVKLFWGFYTATFGIFVFFFMRFILEYMCTFFPIINTNFNGYFVTAVLFIGVVFSIFTFMDARQQNIAVWRRASDEN